MLMAVRPSWFRGVTAKAKIRIAGIADRPLAHSFVANRQDERLALYRRGPRGKAQAVCLSDDSIASHIPQQVGDLTC
jgi:hypothetical protein